MGRKACFAQRSNDEDEHDQRNRDQSQSQVARPELAHLQMKGILSLASRNRCHEGCLRGGRFRASEPPGANLLEAIYALIGGWKRRNALSWPGALSSLSTVHLFALASTTQVSQWPNILGR